MSWKLICQGCGKEIVAFHPLAKWCDACRRQRNNAYQRQRYQAVRDGSAPPRKSARNAAIYVARVADGLTLATIAQQYGISVQRVRRIVADELRLRREE